MGFLVFGVVCFVRWRIFIGFGLVPRFWRLLWIVVEVMVLVRCVVFSGFRLSVRCVVSVEECV